MTFDKDLAVRAVYIRIVGDSTRRLTVKEKRTRSDLERFPLLDILVEPGVSALFHLTLPAPLSDTMSLLCAADASPSDPDGDLCARGP